MIRMRILFLMYMLMLSLRIFLPTVPSTALSDSSKRKMSEKSALAIQILSTAQVDALLAHQCPCRTRTAPGPSSASIFIVFSSPRRASSRVLLPEATGPTIVTSSPGLTLKLMFVRLKSSRCWWLLTAAVVAGDSSVPVGVQVLDADANVLLVVLLVVGEVGEVEIFLQRKALAADKAVDGRVEGAREVEADGENGEAGHEGRTRGVSGGSRRC